MPILCSRRAITSGSGAGLTFLGLDVSVRSGQSRTRNLREPGTISTTLMRAFLAGFRLFFEDGQTLVTSPLDSDSCMTVFPLQSRVQLRRRVHIARISVRIFLEFRRISGTDLASNVFTTRAGGLVVGEEHITQMTVPPHSLPHLLTDQVGTVLSG